MADKGNLYLKNSAVISLYDSTKAYETTVQETLYSQYKTAFKISKSNYFRGDAADSFKNYITNGTINIISGMMDISSDMSMIIQLFAEAFYQYEYNHDGRVEEGALDYINQTLNSKENTFEGAKGELTAVLQLAAKYISTKDLSLGTVNTGYTTYLAKDIRLDKIWAVKVCDKQDRSYSPVLRDSILVETYMMMKLDHPAIPRIVDIIEDENSIFVARDYIEGETLETLIKRSGPQPVDKVINWGKQLCNVLGYLHSQKPPCIYRDVKPANMILRPDNTVALIDFGIARTYKPGQREDTVILGTRGYAAPEQFGGSQTDARTDIFGLGMTMFRLVTGINPTEPPYEVKPIRLVNPNLPQGLEYIISKCTQPNPEERYQTCYDLMDDMDNYLDLPKPKGFFGKLFGKK